MPTQLLSVTESERLAACESVIERGLKTFQDVGNALMEIRDSGLYRRAFTSFEDYCKGRWGLDRRRAYHYIEAATVVENVKNFSQTSPILPPKVESQARVLAVLPAAEQGPAWEEAKAESNGKPTAKKVREVVNRKLGKPAPAPKPDPPGKSKVNGVEVADPPDVAKLRAAGKISPEVVPEVHEPDPEPDPETEPFEPPTETDEEWLAALPLSGQLTGSSLKTFQAQALIYRRLEGHRKTFAHHATRAINAGKRKGPYSWSIQRFLKVNHPVKWVRCCKAEDGGCGGSGTCAFGDCPKCFGYGFWIMGER